MIDKERLILLLERSGMLMVIGVFGTLLGVSLIVDPSYESWRFGSLDFGRYGDLVGGVFTIFSLFALVGGIGNAVKVLKDR